MNHKCDHVDRSQLAVITPLQGPMTCPSFCFDIPYYAYSILILLLPSSSLVVRLERPEGGKSLCLCVSLSHSIKQGTEFFFIYCITPENTRRKRERERGEDRENENLTHPIETAPAVGDRAITTCMRYLNIMISIYSSSLFRAPSPLAAMGFLLSVFFI